MYLPDRQSLSVQGSQYQKSRPASIVSADTEYFSLAFSLDGLCTCLSSLLFYIDSLFGYPCPSLREVFFLRLKTIECKISHTGMFSIYFP